jgi:hypothetical protein
MRLFKQTFAPQAPCCRGDALLSNAPPNWWPDCRAAGSTGAASPAVRIDCSAATRRRLLRRRTPDLRFEKQKAGEAIGDCIKRLGDLLHVKTSLTPVLPANASWRTKANFTKDAGKALDIASPQQTRYYSKRSAPFSFRSPLQPESRACTSCSTTFAPRKAMGYGTHSGPQLASTMCSPKRLVNPPTRWQPPKRSTRIRWAATSPPNMPNSTQKSNALRGMLAPKTCQRGAQGPPPQPCPMHENHPVPVTCFSCINAGKAKAPLRGRNPAQPQKTGSYFSRTH